MSPLALSADGARCECQNSTIFSCSGAGVVRIRRSHTSGALIDLVVVGVGDHYAVVVSGEDGGERVVVRSRRFDLAGTGAEPGATQQMSDASRVGVHAERSITANGAGWSR